MIIIDNSKESMHGLQFMIWWFSVQELNDCTPQAPYIRCCSCSGELNDLWCHPVGGPYDAGLMESRRPCSNSKVRKFDKALLCGEDVSAFDVSVNNPLLVKVE